MSEDPAKNAIENSIEWVFKAAELVSEYLEGDEKDAERHNLEKTLQDLCKTDMEYAISQRILAKLEEDSNGDDLIEFSEIQAALTESLEKNRHKIVFKKHPKYMEFIKQSQEVESQANSDEELVCTEAAINIIDPYTKAFIMNPVKNKICGHHYDKEYVFAMLSKKKSLKCPYAGCVSSKFTKTDLFEDKKLSQQIHERVSASQQLANESASSSVL